MTEHEVQLVAQAARDGWYLGMIKYIEEFERRFSEYTGMTYCLATNSCTAAIHLAMLALRLGPGDEVIVPDITWVASAAPVCYVGARPVLVDIDPVTWCISPEAFERAITRRTKAVVVVGLLGNMPEMDAIRTMAAKRGIPIIEDAAESAGATYRGKKAGTFGTINVFSFNGTKLMVTGEGGMFATNDKRLYLRAKGLAHHGLLMQGKRSKFYWSYELGYKYKMTNVQAALGLAQLSRIDELVAKRRQNFFWYHERLKSVEGLQLNQEGPHVNSTFWIVTGIVSPRYRIKKEALVRKLVERKIGGRPFFYPISAMPPFTAYGRGRSMRKANPVSYRISPYGICLPSSAALTEADVDYVCEQLMEILTARTAKAVLV
ncbi:MAG: DegT/DnrJ/EryC1/StrS family aminotransferase [Candidatus Omnitrophica bacterium]|nr:DegT/DnrJ/EryC1/StrS family aminotransferase [Candidatus Omnitrophota bacterium]